jgi:hypothetical protein
VGAAVLIPCTAVDSPGVDVAQGLDEGLDEVCQDADLFVLVQNAEEDILAILFF